MTFQSSPTMPANPPIRILFHGLIVLESPDGKTCVGGLHRDNETHTTSVEVRAKTQGQADITVARHVGRFSGSHPGLLITGDKASAAAAAFKYLPTTTFDPTNPTHGERDDDFRWAINLEGSDFHDSELMVDEGKTRPGVAIENSVCYFHTGLLKKDDINVFQGISFKRRIKGIAGVVAANLYLDDGGIAVVKGPGFEVPIAKPTDSRVSYEIYIDNSPLFEPPGSSHSELKEYYKVLKKGSLDIPPGEQFELDFSSSISLREGEEASLQGSSKFDAKIASIRIPCMPIVLDGNG